MESYDTLLVFYDRLRDHRIRYVDSDQQQIKNSQGIVAKKHALTLGAVLFGIAHFFIDLKRVLSRKITLSFAGNGGRTDRFRRPFSLFSPLAAWHRPSG